MKKLSKAQEGLLKKHKQHHTSGHMRDMRRSMLSGKSFKAAHIFAKKNEKK